MTYRRNSLELGAILLLQGLERLAWNGLAPQLAAFGPSMGLSEGQVALVLSLFTLATFMLAYPLGLLADTWGAPRDWALAGLLLLATGYLLVAGQMMIAAASCLAMGCAAFRLGVGLLISGMPGDSQPAWWRIHLAVNIGAAIGGSLAQHVSWRHGLPAVGLACLLAILVGLLVFPVLPRGAARRQAAVPSDSVMVAARWWAVSRLCFLAGGVYLAAVQPLTSMTLFVAQTSRTLGPVRLGAGSYASLHGVLVAVVIVAALVLRWGTATVRVSVWAFVATAAGFALLACAGRFSAPVSPYWLLGAYGLMSLAEPYLFVVGFSGVGKLAPAGYQGRAFGAWYGCIGVSLFVGSLFGLAWDSLGPTRYFGLLALFLLGQAALMHRWASRLDSTLRSFS